MDSDRLSGAAETGATGGQTPADRTHRAPLEPGTLLGPYRIDGRLGAGGMAEVFEATDTRLRRKVAIKITAQRFSDRFQREARAISALNHPNICTLYDIGPDYLVMELVEGTSPSGPLAVPDALAIAAQIAAALEAAHERGIVHRDLKPANVKVTPEGTVKVLDFGLALIQAQGDSGPDNTTTIGGPLTEVGTVMGTVAYMAPEQAKGLTVDKRADIWAFGVLLYELLTGDRPFRGDSTAEVFAEVLHSAPDLNRAPVELRYLLQCCLEKDARQRLRDIGDWRKLLAEPAALPAARRGFRWWPVAAAMAVALFAGGVMAAYLQPEALGPESWTYTPISSNGPLDFAPSFSEDGRNIAYSGMAGGATQVFVRSLDAPTSVQLTSLPQGAYFPFWSPDGSRVYFSSAFRTSRDLMAVGSSGGTPEMVLSGLGGHFFLEGATISHDGKTLAVFRQDPATGVYSIWTSSPPGAALHRIEPSPFQQTTLGAPVTLGFSHDDKQLLFVFGNPALDRPDFWIIPWPEGTGPARRVLQSIPRSTPFVAARWMPDNQHLLLALQPKDRSAGHLWIADIRSGGLRPLTGGYQSESYSDVSPDGKRIVYSTWNDDFDVVEFAANGSGGVHNLLSTRRSEYAPAWSPVRQQFAYVTDRNGDNEIWLHSEAEGTDRPLVTRKDFPGTVVEAFLSPTFSPDGQRIAYGVYDSTGSNIWISSISGSSPVRVLPPGVVKSIPAPAWSPDGDWIAYRSERPEGTALEKIRVGSGSPVSIVKTPVPFAPQWSPDGKWISMQTEEGFTIVSPDGAEKHVLNHRPDPGRGYAYGWERSGKSILAVTPEVTGHTALIRIDVPSGAEHRIADLGADRSFEGRYLWDVRLSISPDGSRVASARTNRTADLWMIAGFDQPRGLLERWLRGRR